MRFIATSFMAAGLMGMLSNCSPEAPDLSDLTDQTGQTAAPSTPPIVESSAQASLPLTAQEAFPIIPGRYCYRLEDGTTTTHLRLTLNDEGQIQGDARSTVENNAAAYYTSYTQVFSGTLTSFDATVDVTTWIEYDVQTTRESWDVTSEILQTENGVLDLADCQLVDPIFQDDSGLEARDLLDGAAAVHRQRVEFAPGKRAASVSNAVIRGERDVYLLGASGGQQMDLSITSLENNAVFDVISPSGYILAREAMDKTVFLPHTGDYQVIVGGTRGNATYDLTIGIQ